VAQGDGGKASGGPGVASYREEKGREGRMAGRHGGVEVAEPAAVADACGCEERPRGRARAKSRARAAPGSEGERGGLHWPAEFPRNSGSGAGTEKQGNSQRKKKG
jgi:hypothetical protein